VKLHWHLVISKFKKLRINRSQGVLYNPTQDPTQCPTQYLSKVTSMAKLSAMGCEAAQPHLNKDRLFGDGDGLFLRIRRPGKKTWVIEYELNSSRTKYTIGRYSRNGARGDSISAWLRNGEQSAAQARAIAAAGRRREEQGMIQPQNGKLSLVRIGKQTV
jgi:hypothetical protein